MVAPCFRPILIIISQYHNTTLYTRETIRIKRNRNLEHKKHGNRLIFFVVILNSVHCPAIRAVKPSIHIKTYPNNSLHRFQFKTIL